VHFLFDPHTHRSLLIIGKLFILIGIKSSELRILDEAFAYSLSKERTTTKLFIMGYKKIMNAKFVEMSLQELISRFAFTYYTFNG
jgi:hypothetical protein